MYIPAHFAAGHAIVLELLARHGAADLITLTADGLLATMLPFAYEPAAGGQGALAMTASPPPSSTRTRTGRSTPGSRPGPRARA